MKTLQDRIAELGIDTNYIDNTVLKLKQIKNLYIFGAGDRALFLADYLSMRQVNIEGFLVNEAFLKKKTILSQKGYKFKVSSYEKKIEEGNEFSIVLGVSSSLLNMAMFDHPTVREVFSLSVGVRSDYLITPEMYEQHVNELNWLYEIAEDDYSREVLFANIAGRLSGKDIEFTPSAWSDPQYFLPDLMEWQNEECVMDGGAFIGDTVEEFLAKKPNNVSRYKVYAWEPDLSSFEILSKNYVDNPNIIPLNKGMYSRSDTLCFNSSEVDKEASYITDDGDIEIEVSSIDEVADSEKVTFIKMDIEGSELEALKGAEHQIINNIPRLAICLYHKQEDMWTIPQYIHSLNPSYKMYLRTHSSMPTELALFCVPSSSM